MRLVLTTDIYIKRFYARLGRKYQKCFKALDRVPLLLVNAYAAFHVSPYIKTTYTTNSSLDYELLEEK